jgi:hypothetical protein
MNRKNYEIELFEIVLRKEGIELFDKLCDFVEKIERRAKLDYLRIAALNCIDFRNVCDDLKLSYIDKKIKDIEKMADDLNCDYGDLVENNY